LENYKIKFIYTRRYYIALKNYPRYLISKEKVNNNFDDSEVGRMLGFKYLKSDFGDYINPRWSIDIYFTSPELKKDIQSWNEVTKDIKLSKPNAEQFAKKWNNIVKFYPFPYLKDVKFYMNIEYDAGMQIRFNIHKKLSRILE